MSQSIQDAYQNRFTARLQIQRGSATSTLENGWREFMAAKLASRLIKEVTAAQLAERPLRIATYKPIAVGNATDTATRKLLQRMCKKNFSRAGRQCPSASPRSAYDRNARYP